ncbi:hypothetical protein B7990_11885 [Fibrobacter sp. UWB4]|uniref:GNAT family N-acetyltransferase n=1 Tax=Fibrobacter sp. UWB4 TaxID=1964356 RepID=UPI000B51F688|nr:GNAT family N-acetyltransferase [Fibrobacter sp. UWB4]OWV16432.1 hypothetical protein B7990_11885 [Fibrobacter sp. UWB4]
MNVVVKKREETDITYDQIVNLMHDAFEERLQQGLNFKCSSMTVDEFKKCTEHSAIFVAINLEDDSFLGFGVVSIKEENQNQDKYAFIQDLSISPKVKRCGIGSKLQREMVCVAQNSGCKYMECTTAVGAKSSVKYHLKQGYKIIGLTSFPTTNYYSYVFRMYLQPSIWQNGLYCKIKYAISYLKTHLTKKEDGSFTLFGCMLKRCRS